MPRPSGRRKLLAVMHQREPTASSGWTPDGTVHVNAGADQAMFGARLAASVLIAGTVAYPFNRWLLAGGKGHAVQPRHRH
jgi:hypothetical protein